MKKILIVVFLIALSISAFGQARARNGISIGDHKISGTHIKVVDSLTVNNTATPTDYAVVIAGDTLNPVYSTTGQGNLFDYAVKLVPDTVHVTDPTYTVLATNASKVHVFYNDFTLVTIAAYATQPIPVGTWTTFISMGGKVRFTGTNVHSELDSLTINLRGYAQLWKQGQNDNEMSGSLLN